MRLWNRFMMWRIWRRMTKRRTAIYQDTLRRFYEGKATCPWHPDYNGE